MQSGLRPVGNIHVTHVAHEGTRGAPAVLQLHTASGVLAGY